MVSAILCLTLAFAAGCADFGRGLTKLTFSPGADPETTVNWVIELDPLDAPAKRTLFLTVRNISGEDDIDIENALRDRIEKRHYILVSDPNAAEYHLLVEVRSFGETKLDGGQEQAKKLGAIAGAAARRKDGTLSNVVKDDGSSANTQGVAENLASTVTINATSIREWAVITDVIVSKRLAKPLTVELAADMVSRLPADAKGQPKQQVKRAEAPGTFATRKMLVNYWPYGARVSVAAKQVALTGTEAKPLIEPKLLATVAGTLP